MQRQIFLDKFGWVLHYSPLIHLLDRSLAVFRSAKNFLHQNGLERNSYKLWLNISKTFANYPLIQANIEKVTDYLTSEGQKIPNDKIFPAISDIIESLFSKYKKFSSSAPYSEINEMVLSMVLATNQITPQTVFEAMSTINTSTLKQWIKEVFGESMIAKRKAVFSDL